METMILAVLKKANKFRGRKWICKALGKPYSCSMYDPVYRALCRLRERGKLEFDINMGFAVVSDSVMTPSSSDKRNSKLFKEEKKRYGKRVMGL